MTETAGIVSFTPTWRPRTEPELRAAADAGLLEETHHLDLKRELESGKSANKKIACDIAAFAVDGGMILIGVDEDTTPPSLSPVELAGMSERIEQIALMSVDEPIRVQTTAIAASGEPGKGYLVVHVPVSPRAPHMVDGRYYARGDKTNHVLSHAEVLRFHERKLAGSKDILAEARSVLDDLTRGGREGGSALILVAEPLGAGEDLLVPLAESPTWQSTAMEYIGKAAVREAQDFSPSLARAYNSARRAGGVAIITGPTIKQTFGVGDGRAEVVFRETGTLVLASERPTAIWSFPNVNPRPDDVKVIFETLILGHTDLLVRLAAVVAQQHGFAGSWRFGLTITGLRDGASHSVLDRQWGDRGPLFTGDTYERSSEASLLDLINDPRSTVKTLVQPLLRSIGSHTRLASFFNE
ncbi:AlbA family DNA-binding domain-containing protein [Nocardia mikamii]|uniref:AlbA family DNA-binding domain-containing protein n=1 Tax=Nocardia mikamii TaxID=508464 RepID=UPI000A586289|nr:ATP-binding protein [Nocardia mikamii]